MYELLRRRREPTAASASDRPDGDPVTGMEKRECMFRPPSSIDRSLIRAVVLHRKPIDNAVRMAAIPTNVLPEPGSPTTTTLLAASIDGILYAPKALSQVAIALCCSLYDSWD